MTAMHILGTTTATIGGLLILWLAHLGRSAWLRHHAAGDEFARADTAKIHAIPEEDQFVRDMRAAAADARATTTLEHTELSSLPSAEARTAQFAALASDRLEDLPDIDTWHPQVVAVDDYITGEIVAYRGQETQTDMTVQIVDRLHEFHSEWHWVGGELFPPTGLVNALHDDDWLRQLLEQDLVPA